jgi:hypothetical protein
VVIYDFRSDLKLAFDGAQNRVGVLRGIYPTKCSFSIPHPARDNTDPLFLFALLKFIFWHSLGIGVLSRQKSMHLSLLHAWDELHVYGIDPIFALIMLSHSMGLLRVHLALHVFISQYLEYRAIDVINK